MKKLVIECRLVTTSPIRSFGLSFDKISDQFCNCLTNQFLKGLSDKLSTSTFLQIQVQLIVLSLVDIFTKKDPDFVCISKNHGWLIFIGRKSLEKSSLL